MYKFKDEFQNCEVYIKSHSLGRIKINTAQADPNKWQKIPEFEHLFERVEAVPQKEVEENTQDDSSEWDGYTLSELREVFPDIKSNSKAKFIEQILEQNG